MTATPDLEELRRIIADTLDVELEEVTDSAHFVETLGVDSLMALEVMVVLEQHYKVRIAEERLPVVAPEDIINEALARVVRHTGDGEFSVLGLIEGPTCFIQQQVDEGVPGRSLIVVMDIRNSRVRRLGSGDCRMHLGARRRDALLVQPGCDGPQARCAGRLYVFDRLAEFSDARASARCCRARRTVGAGLR